MLQGRRACVTVGIMVAHMKHPPGAQGPFLSRKNLDGREIVTLIEDEEAHFFISVQLESRLDVPEKYRSAKMRHQIRRDQLLLCQMERHGRERERRIFGL